MAFIINIIITLVLLQLYFIHLNFSYRDDDEEPIPSDYYALEIRGGRKFADMIASVHGFRVVREIGDLNTYIIGPNFQSRKKRSTHEDLVQGLEADPHVRSIDRQHYRIREKRRILRSESSQKLKARVHSDVEEDASYIERRVAEAEEENLEKRASHTPDASDREGTRSVEQSSRRGAARNVRERERERKRDANSSSTFEIPAAFRFNDPYFKYEWYLVNTGELFGEPRRKRADLNILPAWLSGLNGTGVISVVVDDGLETTNEDLAANYDASSSTNLVERNRSEPTPYGKITDSDGHGTKCAAMIAAVANNSWCGVGAAFASKVGGVRLLGDNKVLDSDEAEALLWASNTTNFYSMSWGPTDNGKVMEGPPRLTQKALEYGARHGRNGLGNIYVMAGGNGGRSDDNCGADGYVQSEYTISINVVNPVGERTFYDEQCAGLTASVYLGSSGDASDATKKAILADERLAAEAAFSSRYGGIASGVNHVCATNFVGTSAGAPLAVGCFALSLQANGTLNWRDLLHLIARTARLPVVVLPGENDWYYNGAGFHVSKSFGFGVLDCAAMAQMALGWPGTPSQSRCTLSKTNLNKKLAAGTTVMVELDTSSDAANESSDACAHLFDSLEYVLVHVNLSYPVRGNVALYLQSPSGMDAVLLGTREPDVVDKNITFKFKSNHQWGENPYGTWIFKVELLSLDELEKKSLKERAAKGGILGGVTITLTGTNSSQWPPGTQLKGTWPAATESSASTDEEATEARESRESESSQLNAKAVKISNSHAQALIDAESKRSVALTERLLGARAAIARRAGQPVHVERRREEEEEANMALRELLADLRDSFSKRSDEQKQSDEGAEAHVHVVSKRDTRSASSALRGRAYSRT